MEREGEGSVCASPNGAHRHAPAPYACDGEHLGPCNTMATVSSLATVRSTLRGPVPPWPPHAPHDVVPRHRCIGLEGEGEGEGRDEREREGASPREREHQEKPDSAATERWRC